MGNATCTGVRIDISGGISGISQNVSAAGIGIPSASFKTYNDDGLAHNVIGTANIAFTPYANKWAITNNPFHALGTPANNLGLGFDVGLVYYMNPNDAMVKQKGYLTRFAASITDIGSISYSASSTTGSYKVNDKNIDYKGMVNDEGVTFGNRIFRNYLVDTVASPKASSNKFKVGLPTALHLNADFKVEGRFWVNANVLVNLRQPSADKYSNHYVSTLTVTPRYSVGKVSFSVPFSFNAAKQGYLGAIVFAGPFYLGSNSLFQLITSNSINNINILAGSNLRIKPKRQKIKDMMMM